MPMRREEANRLAEEVQEVLRDQDETGGEDLMSTNWQKDTGSDFPVYWHASFPDVLLYWVETERLWILNANGIFLAMAYWAEPPYEWAESWLRKEAAGRV